ncbi:DUF4332 domain-containing protein [Lyngbya aestuarii]|uniref:DUF4332 domain-containing protein n=1 Tax=Lyngbya aestuarii TaxID=118322 RepID=UPI00403DDA9B
MAHYIKEIEGIGSTYASKLAEVGITTVEALREKGASPESIQELVQATEIDEARIIKWINMANLFQINGVGEEYSELLLAAGIESVEQLSNSVSELLYAKMVALNENKHLVRQTPGLSQVEDWINQSKAMQENPQQDLSNETEWSVEWSD